VFNCGCQPDVGHFRLSSVDVLGQFVLPVFRSRDVLKPGDCVDLPGETKKLRSSGATSGSSFFSL